MIVFSSLGRFFNNVIFPYRLYLYFQHINMFDVVVVGGCIIDLISYIDRFPRPGETMTGKEFQKGFGGKGANQCVMAMKLGGTTGLIAKLGDDSFGHEYLKSLKENGINYDNISLTSKSHTSTASISVTTEGQNCIIYIPGAINLLTPDDIISATETIKNSKVLLCTYECPQPTLLTALTEARKHKVKTVVNAAPTTNPSYEQLYPYIDIICLNEVEAEDATQIVVKTIEDASLAIKHLFGKGCDLVILTLGAKGAIFQSKLDKAFTHVPAKPVQAVDTTGAGDAFMGSLAYYLARHPNMSLETAIRKSCDIAALSVLKKGTQTSYPNRKDLPEEFL